MSLFNVSFPALVKNLLYRPLRQPKTLAWLEAVTAPAAHLYNRLLAYRALKDYDLAHNGQVCKLEGLLNDTFDPLQRRIYIEDANPAEPLWIRTRAEAQPVHIYTRAEAQPVFIYTRAETAYGPMFTVRVPVSLVFDPARMRALVNKYRIPSSVFTIQTF